MNNFSGRTRKGEKKTTDSRSDRARRGSAEEFPGSGDDCEPRCETEARLEEILVVNLGLAVNMSPGTLPRTAA